MESETKLIQENVVDSNGETTTKQYKKGKFLGRGGFAEVYKLVCVDTGKVYAAKIVPKTTLSKSKAREKLLSEIKIHRTLHHTNIVRLDRFFEDSSNVYILLELCPNNSLRELLLRRKLLTEIEAQYYLVQVISAVKHIHSQKVIHRDLKVGNLFLSKSLEIKLGDFGLAVRVEYEGQKRTSICGTPNYIAPEVLNDSKGHSYEADVWAIGVILYNLLVGKAPFDSNEARKTYSLIRMNAYSFPTDVPISLEAKSLITRILKSDPAKRPSLDEILMHQFFHKGNHIPRQLPMNTLVVPPSEAFVRSFAYNSMTVKGKCATARLRKVQSIENTSNLMSICRPDYTEPVYIVNWVNHSEHYGLGYLLSDGSVGVYYRDNSSLVMGDNQYFCYIEKSQKKKDLIHSYSLDEFPDRLHKKVSIFTHFKEFLTKTDSSQSKGTFVYIKKWTKIEQTYLFRFSNKLIHIIFKDNTGIIVSNDFQRVLYIDENKEHVKLTLPDDIPTAPQEILKCIKYAKSLLSPLQNSALSSTQ